MQSFKKLDRNMKVFLDSAESTMKSVLEQMLNRGPSTELTLPYKPRSIKNIKFNLNFYKKHLPACSTKN